MEFSFVRSQADVNCSLQFLHSPQAIGKAATTRSPALTFFTVGPTLSTTPQNSWPRTSPFSNWGMTPKTKDEPARPLMAARMNSYHGIDEGHFHRLCYQLP